MKNWYLIALGLLLAVAAPAQEAPAPSTQPSDDQPAPIVRIGSKSFTESVVLGQLVVHLAEDAGAEPLFIEGLGGTRIVWEALLAGEVDVYAEYTGTLLHETLVNQRLPDATALRTYLATQGLSMTKPLGFNNTYALGMKEDLAAELGITKISDLRDHPDLILRFSNEFMERADGWPALAAAYDLPHGDVRGLEHALAYEAIDKGTIDVIDIYATDAKVQSLDLRVLRDDLSFFPPYDAVFVYRNDLTARAPELVKRLHDMEGRISASEMVSMNARVELDGDTESEAAAEFLREKFGIQAVGVRESNATLITKYTLEHLNMVGVSLAAALLVAIPLGIVAANWNAGAQPILGIVGIIQTIPAIALLVLLIKPVGWFVSGLGYPQAVVALFLYSLLPIVRNTHAGLKSMAPDLHESAIVLGLTRWARLWRIELPLASRTILAGVKTAAVINVGFATLGGFIGAGGYGEPIFTGIRRSDYSTIMMGAVPAALLALAVQGAFELAERLIVPRGLRLRRVE